MQKMEELKQKHLEDEKERKLLEIKAKKEAEM